MGWHSRESAQQPSHSPSPQWEQLTSSYLSADCSTLKSTGTCVYLQPTTATSQPPFAKRIHHGELMQRVVAWTHPPPSHNNEAKWTHHVTLWVCPVDVNIIPWDCVQLHGQIIIRRVWQQTFICGSKHQPIAARCLIIKRNYATNILWWSPIYIPVFP